MAQKPSITVIGAGIVGICSAAYLQREGFDVEIVDPEPPGTQCSFGNAGALCPGACLPNAMPGILRKVPEWLADPEGPLFVRLAYLPQALPWLIRFVLASRRSRVEAISVAMRSLHKLTFDCYEPLVRDAGVADLIEKHGQLFVYSDPAGVDGDAWGRELRIRQGVKIEILDEDELRQLAPAVSRIFKRAVYLPEQGQCRNPGKLAEELAAHAVRQGAKLTRARVLDFDLGPEGPRALLTDAGRIACERVVIAAGAWSGTLARKLGSHIPLETERGYHAMVMGATLPHRMSTMWAERKFAATPMEMGMRFAGTVEIAGLKPPPDYHRADVLLKHGREMFPDIKIGEVSRWMGHRPGTPDSIPVLGRAPRHRNVFFAFGHGHQGLMAASVTGKLIGELAAGKPTSIDLTPFRADRF
ncbi:MAG: FAD-dependent oxidoreductase [Hyphomicrobiaceae bacterium]